MSLLEQDIIKNKQVNKTLLELEVDNSKKCKFETI